MTVIDGTIANLDEARRVKILDTLARCPACGDMRRGRSLVVWAIGEGRECARGVDAYLMGRTDLPASPDAFCLDVVLQWHGR